MRPVAWLLNLDADHELARPRGYTPSAARRARGAAMAERLVGLVREDDVVLNPWASAEPRRLGAGWVGRAWCPTPSARRQLARVGAELGPAPDFEVVRRVNHRRFAHELGGQLPGAAWLEDEASVLRALARGSTTGAWVLKRPFGMAGSGRRVLRHAALSAHDATWLRASIARDGLLLEPWVDIVDELALHGFVDRDGAVTLGEPCRLKVDAHGAWVDTRVLGEPVAQAPGPASQPGADAPPAAPSERSALVWRARQVADALVVEGYFGPFGIDAYRFRDDGRVLLHPLSELNARYTMGWAIGMGARRPDLP